MSLRFGSLGLFFSLVAIALAANHADQEREKTTRGPASIAAIRKEEKLGPFLNASTALKHTEKLRGPLNVKIELVGDAAPKTGETFVLRGTISSRKALSGAGYAWSVPAGISVVNGAMTGELQNISAEQPAVIELTLKKISEDNSQVHLMASAVNGDARFGDSAQFNTDVQNMMGPAPKTAQKAAVLNGVEMVNQADKSGQLKIFH